MRTILRLIFGGASFAIVLLIIISFNSLLYPDAPFLGGDREEANRTLTSIAFRSFCCLAALSVILTISLKWFRPRSADKHDL